MSSPIGSSGANSVLSRVHTYPYAPTFSRPSFDLATDLSLEEALSRLEIENRLKEGAENLLQVLDTRTRERPKEARGPRRQQVMEELDQTNSRITSLKARIEDFSSQQPLGNYRRQRSEELLGSRLKNVITLGHRSRQRASAVTDHTVWSITDLLAGLLKTDQEPPYYISRANELVSLLRRHNSLRQDLTASATSTFLVRFCSSTNSNLVAAGYRVARHIIREAQTAEQLLGSGLERCLVVSLAKDHKSNIEREHAIKLIRHIYMLSKTPSRGLSAAILRALVSLAEAEDRIAPIALETLAEVSVLSPELAVQTGGLRSLLNSLVDGSPLVSDENFMVINYALECPATRKNLQPGRDLNLIFSPFTEYIEGKRLSVLEERLISTTTVIQRLLNSWPGLLGASMYNYQGIRSVVDALRVPRSAVRAAILDFLFAAMSIPADSIGSTFLAGSRLSTMGRIPLAAESSIVNSNRSSSRQGNQCNLMKQFAALKLLLFLEVGVLDALMVLIEDKEDLTAARKATLLLGEILQLSNVLLPLSHCRNLQSLPRLFASAANLRDNFRLNATSALYQIESLNRTRNKANIARIINSSEVNSKRGQRQVEQVKIKMGLQIDDAHFRNLLLNSQVLSTKNYTKWHWDTLTELVQGPLLNPKRLEESIRATKFMKRLLAFYRPFTHRFSSIKNTKPNQKYIKFGCLLLNTLLANAEGVRYLTESKLLRQLSECLAQMDPMNHVTASDALFSQARISETLCYGYFDLIGVLSSHPMGIAMMERWRMFSNLYHLTELRSRADLVTLFLARMDYTYEGHARIILSKASTAGPLEVRLFATELLGTLIQDPNEEPKKLSDWAIRLLVNQLYDPSTDVCEEAVTMLERACDSPVHLEYIVELRPALDHLGEVGSSLLLKFLATSVGFHYLKDLSYVDKEMDDWFHGRNDEYVYQIEASLLNALAPATFLSAQAAESSICIPHFYGELAKTAEGVEMLLSKGHFVRYVELLQTHWKEETDMKIVHKVKAALWAIGSIGATRRGAPFLKDCQVMQSVVRIAEQSRVATMKGTAYFVLGMLSCTHVGVELLTDFRWYGVVTNMQTLTGICVPEDVGRVLNLEAWTHNASIDLESKWRFPKEDPLSVEILTAMSNLSNHILANEAAKTLIRLRRKYPAKFSSLHLYEQAHELLAHYNYRLAVRRFVMELFSQDVLSAYLSRKLQIRPNRGYSLPKRLSSDSPSDVIHGLLLSQPEVGDALDSPQSFVTGVANSGSGSSTPIKHTRTRSQRAATLGA